MGEKVLLEEYPVLWSLTIFVHLWAYSAFRQERGCIYHLSSHDLENTAHPQATNQRVTGAETQFLKTEEHLSLIDKHSDQMPQVKIERCGI